MLKIGLTGGIGSGKSMVSKVFSLFGVPIYYADERAKWLITNDELLKSSIISLLGNEAYTPQGAYNRRWVASLVFDDSELLKKLNALVHPAVYADRKGWFEQNIEKPYVLIEAAIMNKAGVENQLDYVIAVMADEDVRKERIRQRDPLRTEKEIENIIAAQKSAEAFKEMANFLVYNNPSDSILRQVNALHHHFLTL